MSQEIRNPLAPALASTKKSKIVTAEDAIRLIKTGDVVATTGIVGCVSPEHLLIAIEQAFLAEGRPRDLTLMIASQTGNSRSEEPRVGNNHFAHEGLLRCVIAGHWGMAPMLGELAMAEKIEGYVFPQGVLAHLFREMAGGKPGALTRVGLGTFIDPRNDGGKINQRTTKDLVELMHIAGEEYLFYHAVRPNVAILRGTTADLDGNISMEREALFLEVLQVATAVYNNGGTVIVQVERITDRLSIHPRDVKIPGILVDCVVVAPPEHHRQTGATAFNPAFASEIRVPAAATVAMPLTERKIIARRAAFAIRPNSVVNLGIGMPEGVGAVANEENVASLLTMTNEPGGIGGVPQGGGDFGAAINVDALIDQPAMFDLYDGGALDCAFLGMAQVDREGNVNVSRFGPRVVGVGGFVNISQNAKTLVFMGTFTAGKHAFSISEGGLHIEQDGPISKFVEQVDQLTYSGRYAAARGQKVLYVTERCVFRLAKEGLELIEIAPGVDLERDILGRMPFKPIIRGELPRMDARIFKPEPMGLRDALLDIPVGQRMSYDSESNTLFVNFEGLVVRDQETVAEIGATVERIVQPLGRKTRVIANYDNLEIYPHVFDAYVDMGLRLRDRFFEAGSVFTTSTFLRMKLGDALAAREVASHIAWSREEALATLDTAQKPDRDSPS